MDRPRVLRPCLLHAGAPETPVQVEGTWEPALHFRRKCPPLVHCLVQVQLLPPGASTPPSPPEDSWGSHGGRGGGSRQWVGERQPRVSCSRKGPGKT